jgi:hypothetical protein
VCVRIKIRDSRVTTPLAGMAKYEIMKQCLLRASGHIWPVRVKTRHADNLLFFVLTQNFLSARNANTPAVQADDANTSVVSGLKPYS